MTVTNDETLFSRNSHRNPKDIGSELGNLAANANFLIVILEESAAMTHELQIGKPVLHKLRGGCIRELGRAEHEHRRTSRLGLARDLIEQIGRGDAFGKCNATPKPG